MLPRFILFRSETVGSLFINLGHIVSVRPCNGTQTALVLSCGATEVVDDSYELVITRIEKELNKTQTMG